jgi:hypothetical protein
LIGGLVPLSGFAFAFQRLLAAKAFVGVAAANQFMGRRQMICRELTLKKRPRVPVDTQPLQTVQDTLNRGLAGAFRVGILDAQDELAAVLAREQPIEYGGAGTTDMQVPAGTGCEPNNTTRHANHPVCVAKSLCELM